jgi:hypothetical protein
MKTFTPRNPLTPLKSKTTKQAEKTNPAWLSTGKNLKQQLNPSTNLRNDKQRQAKSTTQ